MWTCMRLEALLLPAALGVLMTCISWESEALLQALSACSLQ